MAARDREPRNREPKDGEQRQPPPKGEKGELPRRRPLGDVLPEDGDIDPRTRGGQPPEKVEDRGTTGTVKPEDYPADDRARG